MQSPPPFKIAIVAASAPPHGAGGVASAHYNLFRALQARGYATKLFTFYDNGIPKTAEEHIVRRGASLRWVKLAFFLAQLPFRLLQPGKLAYHSGEIVRSMLGSARMAKAIHNYHPQVIILSDHGAPGSFVKKRPGQKIFLVSHHNPARFAKEPSFGDVASLDLELALAFENRILKKVDGVVCPSRYMQTWFRSTYEFSGPVRVIPNLIDEEFLDSVTPANLQTRLDLTPDSPLVYLPSAGSMLKGGQFLPAILAGVLASFPNAGFYIPGQVEPSVREKLNPAWLRQILMPGQVSYREHIANVLACSVGISPALMENFSMALLEATMGGVPMATFRIGGNEDIIDEGKNGYLVPPFDVDQLVTKAVALVSDRGINQRAKQHTREKFNSHSTVKQYIALIGD